MGNQRSCFLGSTGWRRTARDNDIYLEAHKLGRKGCEAIAVSIGESPLNGDVFPLHVVKLAKSLPERLNARGVSGKGATL
jgi:hypothetical protein